MPRFTIPVREHRKVIGEASVEIPALAFVPEAAAYVVEPDGRERALLGWGGRLWAPVAHPDTGGPLDAEAFAALVSAERDPNPFATPEFDNPFEPNRFAFPLDLAGGKGPKAVLKARLAEVDAAARGLAVIDGSVHRAVTEPVHAVVAFTNGFSVTVSFEHPWARLGHNTFRADRADDAEAYARMLAGRSGGKFLDGRRRLRVVYPSILSRDDVHEAFSDAMGRFSRLADAQGEGLPGAAALAAEARATVLAADRLDGPEAAEAASSLCDRMRELLRGAPAGDPYRDAALEVLELVALRYEEIDRPHLGAAAPGIAP